MSTVKVNGVNRVLDVVPVEQTLRERSLRFYQHRKFYLAKHLAEEPLKAEVDWRPEDFLVPDQGETGLCTGFAGSNLIKYQTGKRPSETCLYSFASMIDPWLDTLPFCTGGGSNGKSILETMKNTGMIPQEEWQFSVPPSFYVGDGDDLLARMAQWVISDYVNLDTVYGVLKQWLSQKGPILTGAMVDINYCLASSSGIVNSYDPSQVRGGHEVIIGGYRSMNGIERFFVDGSWGEKHGDNGRCYYRWSELSRMLIDTYGTIINGFKQA
jgi:hypothetical protein